MHSIRCLFSRLQIGLILSDDPFGTTEKSNVIGWRQTLTSSHPNHICFVLVRAKKIAMWEMSLS
jgi:hypothetical protein